MARIKCLHPRGPRDPWLHRIEDNRPDAAFDCFPPNPRGWKPRPPAFAEASAGRPAATKPTEGRPATMPSGIETAEPSSAVDEASCLVCAVHDPPTRLISSRTFAPFAVQTSNQPPRMTRISRMTRIKFLHPRNPRNPWSHRIENNRNDTAFDCFLPNPRGWKPRPPAFAEPSTDRLATTGLRQPRPRGGRGNGGPTGIRTQTQRIMSPLL